MPPESTNWIHWLLPLLGFLGGALVATGKIGQGIFSLGWWVRGVAGHDDDDARDRARQRHYRPDHYTDDDRDDIRDVRERLIRIETKFEELAESTKRRNLEYGQLSNLVLTHAGQLTTIGGQLLKHDDLLKHADTRASRMHDRLSRLEIEGRQRGISLNRDQVYGRPAEEGD